MANDITLSSAQRQTLLSLQRTSKFSDRTQIRLATGNKINDVTDGPEGYFAARSLDNRADTFTERRNTIEQGVSTIQAALEGIDALDELLGQLRGLARQARSQTARERVETTQSYDEVVSQFGSLLQDTSYQGLNLLNNAQTSLTVEFSDNVNSDLTIAGVSIGSSRTSLGGIFGVSLQLSILRNLTSGFASTTVPSTQALQAGFSVLSNAGNLSSLDALDQRLADAQRNLQTRANSLGNNVAILQTRLDFTDGLTNHLVAGSDKITTADLNEEAANLTATGTQYQIGVQSLGTASQRLQALLQVIR